MWKRVQRSEGKSNIYQPRKEHVRTCKGYVMGREITTILKIAVDNVILELCDSCDYFASPLLIVKPIKFHRDEAVVNSVIGLSVRNVLAHS